MTPLAIEIRCAVAHRSLVGESPVWSSRENVLYWVDILAPALYRYDPATGKNQSWPMPSPIGSIGLSRSGRILCALKTGFHWFDTATGALEWIGHPEPHLPDNRLNDGKVSPDGRFWAGTMDDRPTKEARASLYRLDPDGSITHHGNGLIISNGLAWSPDGRTMYHADSRLKTIFRYTYDPQTGSIGPRQLFVEPLPEWGRPDGAAVDVEGCYWVCGIGTGRVNRFSPEGELLAYLQLPVSKPTMPCFGGPGLRTLYITSLSNGLSAEELDKEPLAGSMFACEPGVAGVPVNLFDA